MSLDMNDYRPIFSGLVGTILAAILAWYICKNTPSLLSNNQLEDVKKNYGKRVDVANFLSLLGFGVGMCLYFTSVIPRNDWRGIGVSMGLIVVFPLIYFLFILKIRNVDGLIAIIDAFAKIHTTPRFLMYLTLIFFFLAGAIAVLFFLQDLFTK
ncbi:MAG: hypothetical protein ACK5VX_12185 [Akkermansiaceae bacterium]|jgi:hypothetical protein